MDKEDVNELLRASNEEIKTDEKINNKKSE